MNYLLKKPDGSIMYPYSLTQLRTDNPTTSFPEDIESIASEWNCFQVTATAQPAYNPVTHTLTEGQPTLQGDVYQQSWQVVPHTLEQAKNNKLAAIESEWQQLEANGWDCGQGHLGITANDVALLSGCHALGKEADALGLPIPSIVTMENNEITFTAMAQFTQLMLQYGAYRAQLSSTFAARRRAVAAAATLEELESIP